MRVYRCLGVWGSSGFLGVGVRRLLGCRGLWFRDEGVKSWGFTGSSCSGQFRLLEDEEPNSVQGLEGLRRLGV